jgi:hypothetical protein
MRHFSPDFFRAFGDELAVQTSERNAEEKSRRGALIGHLRRRRENRDRKRRFGMKARFGLEITNEELTAPEKNYRPRILKTRDSLKIIIFLIILILHSRNVLTFNKDNITN